MKKLKSIFAIALLISVSQSTFAQDSSNSDAKFGIKGGVNFSNLYTDNVDDNNVLVGFNLGLFAKLPITKFLAIQPEVYYTTKGAELTYNNVFVNGKAKFSLNYIEVPVLAVINLTSNLNVHAGPYFAYLIDSKVKNESNGTAFDFESTLNNDDFNRFEAGLSLGLGLDIDSFSVGARYNYGLTTVGKERNFSGTNYTFPDGKNSVFNIYASFSLN